MTRGQSPGRVPKAHWFEITDDLPQFDEYAG